VLATLDAERNEVPHPYGSHIHGKAVQVDPIKPTLKAPGTKRLKLKYVLNGFQVLLSISTCAATPWAVVHHVCGGRQAPPAPAAPARGQGSVGRGGRGGVAGRGLHSSTSQLNLSRFSHSTNPLNA